MWKIEIFIVNEKRQPYLSLYTVKCNLLPRLLHGEMVLYGAPF